MRLNVSKVTGLSDNWTGKYNLCFRLQLPDPEVLKSEIEHEKQRLLEMSIIEEEKKAKG